MTQAVSAKTLFYRAYGQLRLPEGRRHALLMALRKGIELEPSHERIAREFELESRDLYAYVPEPPMTYNQYVNVLVDSTRTGDPYRVLKATLPRRVWLEQDVADTFERDGNFDIAAAAELYMNGNTRRAESLRMLHMLSKIGSSTVFRLR